jgi:hypothetical protein
VTYDPASAVLTHRRQLVYGALKAVERMGFAGRDYLEREIVIVAADFTLSHHNLLALDSTVAVPSTLAREAFERQGGGVSAALSRPGSCKQPFSEGGQGTGAVLQVRHDARARAASEAPTPRRCIASVTGKILSPVDTLLVLAVTSFLVIRSYAREDQKCTDEHGNR